LREGVILPDCSTARPAATKTVPGQRLAQRRRGAEKDQEETPGLVISAALRLCAKKSLREGVILPDCSTARPAATKTVPGERLAQRRRGAEKDQPETPCIVFSAPLRLCAKKSLRECVILTDCSAAPQDTAKEEGVVWMIPLTSPPSFSTQSREAAKAQSVFPSWRLGVSAPLR
jgi:hypothetical protein